jgi:hypothetical protein
LDQERIPSSDQLKPLETLLYDLNVPISQEPPEKFPRSQRICLAFKIVECGLLLSGTTWLSKLDSRVVQYSPVEEYCHNRFLLGTQASKSDCNDNGLRKLAQHIFAIGILLMEIGTGLLVRSTCDKLNFLVYEPGTDPETQGSKVTETQIYHGLTVSMGDKYAGAVSQCLAPKITKCWRAIWRETAEARQSAYKEVLEEYYLLIYKP